MKIIKKVRNCQFEISDHFIRNQKKFRKQNFIFEFCCELILVANPCEASQRFVGEQ
jgi:hypothetical protein